jgi:predicted RND superfamily exporter protein
MTVACLLTSATTAVGLASNVVSTTPMLRTFGIIAASGVMISYAVKLLFLPAVLTWVAPRPPGRSRLRGLDLGIMRVTAAILRRPWLALAGASIFLVASIWGASKVRVDHALLDQFDRNDPVFETTLLLEDELEGVRPLEVYLRSPTPGRFRDPDVIGAIERVEAWAKARGEVVRTMSPSRLVREIYYMLSDDPEVRAEPFRSADVVAAIGEVLAVREPSPLDAWMTPNGKEARVRVSVRDFGAQATLALIDDLRAELERELRPFPDVQASYLGEAYNGSRGQTAVVRDLLSSLGVAVVAIFVMLVLLFRSVRLGLISIPPNLLPLAGTAAYMTVRDIPLNAANVIIFSISIGMAVDGTIHVLQRFRQETARGLRSKAALVRAARGTGRSLLLACVTLSAGFAVLTASSFVPVRRFGELIAVTIASCILATLVLQPALLQLFGRTRSQADAHRREDELLSAAVASRQPPEPGEVPTVTTRTLGDEADST